VLARECLPFATCRDGAILFDGCTRLTNLPSAKSTRARLSTNALKGGFYFGCYPLSVFASVCARGLDPRSCRLNLYIIVLKIFIIVLVNIRVLFKESMSMSVSASEEKGPLDHPRRLVGVNRLATTN